MGVLSELQPKRVFYFFEEICKIPHGSGNTKQISDFCVAFAKDHGLEWHQDEDNNVIIIKEATKGYENISPIIIQGHLDMVCEKEADCPIDMEKEGLSVYVDGDLVRAKGTTLGGDDGIAIAMALAILEDNTLEHPRVEAMFTIDEETGMNGAMSIDVSYLKGHTLLNIDSEDEGIFTVSCAGGNVTRCMLPLTTSSFTGEAIEVKIYGLMGGHSGVEIDRGRANANILMGRLLQAISLEEDIRLVSVDGGLKDNAIPVECKSVFVTDNYSRVEELVKEYEQFFIKEHETTDAGIKISCQKVALSEAQAMDLESTKDSICLLVCLPNGIQTMSHNIEGLVQTSLNLGVLKTEEQKLILSYCVRSSVLTEKEMITRRIQILAERIGATVQVEGNYPGWEYRVDSPLRSKMVALFEEMYGKAPKVEAIHAGLECGLLAGKIKDLDCVSIGPDLNNIHTPRESMSISSVERVYSYVTELLKRLKD